MKYQVFHEVPEQKPFYELKNTCNDKLLLIVGYKALLQTYHLF